MIKRSLNIMGGVVSFRIEANNRETEDKVFGYCEKEIVRLVKIFNFFDEDSYLSRLNKNGKVLYKKELDFVIKKSLEYYNFTDGKFNIFLGHEIEERKKNLISKMKLNESLIRNPEKIVWTDKNYIYFKNDKFKIDLGGIAKGFIVDELIRLVKLKFPKLLDSILIDARGDIGVFSKGQIFSINVENPFNKNIKFEVITLKSGNIITSGHNAQKFVGGSHIVGNKNEILTITLISEKANCYELDTYGTYFSQLKSSEVLEIVEFDSRFKNIEAFLILNNGKVLKSGFWDGFKR